jgi:hypothetical protein
MALVSKYSFKSEDDKKLFIFNSCNQFCHSCMTSCHCSSHTFP